MRTTIANLLLLLGTVLGGIAAANSAKASRWIDLEADAYPGEFVARGIPSGDEIVGAAGEDELPLLVEGGTELTAPVVAALRAAGHDGVSVKDPPIDHELLLTSDREAVEGRILATEITLGQEESEIPGDRRVTGVLLERCAAAGVMQLDVIVDGERETIPTAAEQATEELHGDAAEEMQAEFDEAFAAVVEEAQKGARVAETFTMLENIVVEEGAFLDPPTVDRILAVGVTEADVRIVKRFRLGGWDQRYLYLLALIAMVLGVVLLRATPVDEDPGASMTGGWLGAGEVRVRVQALAEKLTELAGRVDGLAADEIHDALDPLLSEDVYAIVENREAVAQKLGPHGFVTVFGPFASAERQLNRAWSAAVDEYVEEARDSLRRGAAGMAETARGFPEV